jgi:ABC-type Zn uptake system ZnuABC Zn-binding protein ZnuA
LLPQTAGCPHDYSLTPGDMKKIEQADILVAVGLDYEPFLDHVRENRGPDFNILLAAADVKPLADAAAADEATGQRRHVAFNDHPFVSPQQAAIMARTIARELTKADTADEAILQANANRLAAALDAVQADLAAFVATLPSKKVVAVSPIFGYLLRDSGLQPAAVLIPHHDDTLSAGRLAKLTALLKKNHPALILNEDQFDEKIARALGDEIGVRVITLNTQTSGRRGPDAFLAQARAMAAALKEALRGGH